MIRIEIGDIALELETDPSLFSPAHLDAGTRAMLSCVDLTPADKVLDLGCGYGAVGVYAAKKIGEARVTMTDVDETAVRLARENAVRNGVAGVAVLCGDGLAGVVDRDYTLILSNPPYHVDFSVPKRFIEQGFHRLALGGRLYMVTKRRDWYKNKLIAVFGGVQIHDIGDYHVFVAEKRSHTRGGKKKKK